MSGCTSEASQPKTTLALRTPPCPGHRSALLEHVQGTDRNEMRQPQRVGPRRRPCPSNEKANRALQRAPRRERSFVVRKGPGGQLAAQGGVAPHAQGILCLNQFLDLPGSLVDDAAPSVAQVALHGILAGEAVGAVDL